jgi:flagellar assembly protein FliH
VRERAPEAELKASPFPYVDAVGRVSTPDAESPAEEQRQLQQAELQAQARLQGQQEVRVELGAALLREREQIARVIRDFAVERANYYRRIETEVVQLALAVARKILHREAQLDPHALAGIVRVTIEGMDARTKVSLHVPPCAAAEWRHYFAQQMEGELALDVRDDAALAAGECRIETALGATEVGFESQLKEIETGLVDLLAERPGSS